MDERAGYPPGVPCWVETGQPDPRAAADFYGELFGWDVETRAPAGASEDYRVARLDGRDVAAIAGTPPDSDRADWSTYVRVDDVDRTVARVTDAAGAVAVPPRDVGDAGRMAVLTDPTGAALRLWEPRNHSGAQVVNAPGSWNWSNLSTPDPQAAIAFYGTVFGWQARSVDFGAGETWMWCRPGYAEFLEGRDPGLRKRHADAGAPEGFSDAIGWLLPVGAGTDSHWGVTFSAADTDDVAKRAAELGGAVVVPPYTAGPTRVAVVRDPQGAEFEVNTYTPET